MSPRLHPLPVLLLIASLAAVSSRAAEAPKPELVSGSTAPWKGRDDDPEAQTRWNKSPTYLKLAEGSYQSVGLKSFEGIEDPSMKWVVADGRAEHDDFINITDQGGATVRMFLRYRGDWWDGDQGTTRKDRQRAEVKGLGPHQKLGQTFEYGTTFRADSGFRAYGRFCHVMQVKATDGDKGAPLVTLSVVDDTHLALEYVSGPGGKFMTARRVPWKPGEWHTLRFRLKTSEKGDGELLLSIDGDPFAGVSGVDMYRPQATEYRPKWGLYRGTVAGMRDDWVEHKDAVARRLD